MRRFLPTESTASIVRPTMRCDLRDGTRTVGARRGDGPPDEVRPKTRGGPEERVAFRHVPPRRTEARGSRRRSPAVDAGARGERATSADVGRPSTFLTTSSRSRPSATQSVERRGPRASADLRIVGRGQRLERRAAALQVQDRDPVDQDDVRARPPAAAAGGPCSPRRGQARAAPYGLAGSAAASRWTALVAPSAPAGSRTARSRSSAPGQRELRRTEAVDEVAAPDPAGVLERPQDRVDRAEPAVDPLGRDRLAGQHAVALEQGQRLGVEPLRRR